MKFAVQILYFDCEQFILAAIENCAPFVDKIYISYSKLPWTYNQNARSSYENTVNKELIFQSPYVDKIELVEGEWATEEEQRNFCLDKAKNEGYDYMIIQDADEFYTKEAYTINLNEIKVNPDHLYYRTPWHLFWKSLDYIILFDEVHGVKNTTINYSACFAVNCHQDIRFKKNRLLTSQNAMFLSGICYHLSYIMTDDQMKRKIYTWGHSHQVMHRELWYNVKWLGWRPNVKNIGLINPVSWVMAVPFSGHMPKEIQNLKLPVVNSIKPKISDQLKYKLIETKAWFKNKLKQVKNKRSVS